MTLTLSAAQMIIGGTLAEAEARGAKPLAVVVLDRGGHLIASVRQDDASFFRIDIAHAKATGALGMGVDSRVLAEKAKANPIFFDSLTAVLGGRIAFSPGGVLIRDSNGQIIGAIGVSGDTGEVDEECASAGQLCVGQKTEERG